MQDTHLVSKNVLMCGKPTPLGSEGKCSGCVRVKEKRIGRESGATILMSISRGVQKTLLEPPKSSHLGLTREPVFGHLPYRTRPRLVREAA